ncbi:AraC family transcriptional regulator [Deinococcus cellulosilyticus]|uniref:HTH araC/xylS-type domain-containing protein n=1 Tax=Deinococcus cellulosilyticus (strain DSM 18568 / NBRC 106333 / KACC 11606 / 5516J-15) TaxID=1223518 RepID=A0A511MVJ3_DEIC1|nr:AraC family transcriptional regulator [Deinococcus cellulosilyticus]GEM44595.1 hypothetical protein DC3_02300 [Deinococcus cellulosilyticus NBRC 106333 = KACC 11606]
MTPYRTATTRDDERTYCQHTCEPLRAASRAGTLDLVAWGHDLYPGRSFEKHMVPEVRSVGMWNAPRKQQWGLDWHHNTGLEFGYVERGKLGFALEEDSWLLHPGTLTLTRPWQKHRLGNPHVEACTYHWLLLDVGPVEEDSWKWPDWLVCSAQDLKHLRDLLDRQSAPVWHGNAETARCFGRIRSALLLPEPEQVAARLKLHVNELVLATLELLSQQEHTSQALPGAYRTVQLFLGNLIHHLDQPWTLNSMAEHCHLGRSQFSHYCLSITNMTPIDYLNHQRLNLARQLLDSQPELSITEISNRCGFNSSQYFANSFKAREGCTPSEYRKRRFGGLPPQISIS